MKTKENLCGATKKFSPLLERTLERRKGFIENIKFTSFYFFTLYCIKSKQVIQYYYTFFFLIFLSNKLRKINISYFFPLFFLHLNNRKKINFFYFLNFLSFPFFSPQFNILLLLQIMKNENRLQDLISSPFIPRYPFSSFHVGKPRVSRPIVSFSYPATLLFCVSNVIHCPSDPSLYILLQVIVKLGQREEIEK